MLLIYRWFVGITGIANLLGGPAIVMLSSTPLLGVLGSKPFLFVVAGFLSFSGITLIWAAERIEERGVIVFWEGVLRLWAAATFIAMPGWPNAYLVVAGDGSIGLIYVIGLFAIARVPLVTALSGRSPGRGRKSPGPGHDFHRLE